jgi:hypothetical protein
VVLRGISAWNFAEERTAPSILIGIADTSTTLARFHAESAEVSRRSAEIRIGRYAQ